jgi:hypothetical protein
MDFIHFQSKRGFEFVFWMNLNNCQGLVIIQYQVTIHWVKLSKKFKLYHAVKAVFMIDFTSHRQPKSLVVDTSGNKTDANVLMMNLDPKMAEIRTSFRLSYSVPAILLLLKTCWVTKFKLLIMWAFNYCLSLTAEVE